MKNRLSFFRRFVTACSGALEATKQERNLQIQWFIAACVVVAGCVVRLSTMEWTVIALCIGAVLSAEIMNSAIEETVDLLSPERQEHARKAKDFAAGSVLVISITSAFVGLIVFGSHFWLWWNS